MWLTSLAALFADGCSRNSRMKPTFIAGIVDIYSSTSIYLKMIGSTLATGRIGFNTRK